MDHLYSVFGHNVMSYHRHFLEDGDSKIVSSLSDTNILAFTSNFDLNDFDTLLEIHVYVVDLNIPYHPYRVMKHDETITVLEWNRNGTKLLIGDESGQIQIWAMQDFLISDWKRIDRFSFSFSGDRILAGIWFHDGKKLMVNYDKKDLDISYREKFGYKRIKASVVQFGNKHTDGFLCITATGFVCAQAFCANGQIISGYEFLNKSRMNIAKLDISYIQNGQFLVMVTNGNSHMPIYCFTINVSLNMLEKQKLKIQCKSFTSFNLNCALLNQTPRQQISSPSYPKITDLKFIVKEIPDAAVVVACGPQGSIIELWELREMPLKFNNVMKNLIQQQPNRKIKENPTELTWKFVISSVSENYVTALSTPIKLLFEMNPPLSYIIVAFNDNTIKCLYRENLQMLASVDLNSIPPSNWSKTFPGLDMAQNLSIIRDIQLSWSSCAMVAIDLFSQLHVFRLSPMIEPCSQMSLNFSQLILEYALICGHDYWDILIHVKPQFVETICEKIGENFIPSLHTAFAQQKWLDRVLQMKAALYRCATNGTMAFKSGDFYAMKSLNAIAETIKRLIRAREYQENDGPAEKLSYIIQTKPTNDIQQFLNIDKVLVKLDNKDFCVEAPIQQSFQHLLQWVCDLALYLLASIPQQCHQPQFRIPGSGLLHDVKSLNTLRELLVIIRFWSLIDSNYLPSFHKMHENIDVISLIYKLLSKLVLSPDKIDESVVDECYILPNQVMIHQMDVCLRSIGIANPAIYSNLLPLILQYGVEPLSLKYNLKVPVIEGAFNIHGNRRMDVFRYLSLGLVDETSNVLVRSCTRCSAVSLIKSTIRSPAARTWDPQWIKRCVCGGSWRVHASKNRRNILPNCAGPAATGQFYFNANNLKKPAHFQC